MNNTGLRKCYSFLELIYQTFFSKGQGARLSNQCILKITYTAKCDSTQKQVDLCEFKVIVNVPSQPGLHSETLTILKKKKKKKPLILTIFQKLLLKGAREMAHQFKSSCCCCCFRAPAFDSQHPPGSVHPPATLFWPPWAPIHVCTH